MCRACARRARKATLPPEINLSPKRSWPKILARCPMFLTNAHFTKRVHIKCHGCPALWGCRMVCISKNVANCIKKPQFLRVMCAMCRHAPNKPSVTFLYEVRLPQSNCASCFFAYVPFRTCTMSSCIHFDAIFHEKYRHVYPRGYLKMLFLCLGTNHCGCAIGHLWPPHSQTTSISIFSLKTMCGALLAVSSLACHRKQ